MLTIENYKKLEGIEILGYGEIAAVYEYGKDYEIWLKDGAAGKFSTEITLERYPMVVSNHLYCMWTVWNGDRSEIYMSKDELKTPEMVSVYIKRLLDKR